MVRPPSTDAHVDVLAALDGAGVPYEVVRCDPDLSDSDAFGAAYGYPSDRIVNTILVRSRQDPVVRVACVLPSSTRLDVNGTVRRRLGVRKVSFAPAEEATKATGMPPGGVSPFGLPADLAVWIDARVPAAGEPLIFGSGERASKILVSADALRAIPGAEVVEGLALGPPQASAGDGGTDGHDADIEYTGMLASTWDLFRGDTSGWPDRAFYLEAIRRYGEPVLDVGCGTGRLLLDYRSIGLDVDGVDVSPQMLALCAEKAAPAGIAVRTFEQRIEGLDIPRRYRTIIVPSSSFQLLLTTSAAAEGMRRLHRHLEPGGALVMPFMTLWRPGRSLTNAWSRERVRPEDGALIRRHERSRFDPDTGLEDTEDVFEVLLDGRVVAVERHVRSPATRSYTQDEATAVYRAAGFASIELFGEFDWTPAAPDGDVFCAVGIRGREIGES